MFFSSSLFFCFICAKLVLNIYKLRCIMVIIFDNMR